jgi:ribosomal protein S18 acetylase RimI-like enzyme
MWGYEQLDAVVLLVLRDRPRHTHRASLSTQAESLKARISWISLTPLTAMESPFPNSVEAGPGAGGEVAPLVERHIRCALVDIREVRPTEWRNLKSLRLRALETDPDSFGSTVAEERVKPDTAWQEWAVAGWGLGPQTTLVAVDGDHWLGMGVCIVPEEEPHSATVYAMWIDPAARRQGIGQELLQALIKWASSKKVEEMLLAVTDGNTAAMNLYERAGFESTGIGGALRPGSKLRTLSMRKRL